MGKITHNLKISTALSLCVNFLTFRLFFIFFNSQSEYQYEKLCQQLQLHGENLTL